MRYLTLFKGKPSNFTNTEIELEAYKQIADVFWILGKMKREFDLRVQDVNQSCLSKSELGDLHNAQKLITAKLEEAKNIFTKEQYEEIKSLLGNLKINKAHLRSSYHKIIVLDGTFSQHANQFKEIIENFNGELHNNTDSGDDKYAALRKPKIYGSPMMIRLRRLIQDVCNWFNHEWKVSSLSKIAKAAKIADQIDFSSRQVVPSP